jgi:hypothetical protein
MKYSMPAQSYQGLSDSIGNALKTFAMMPEMRQKWADENYNTELKQRGLMADMSLKDAQRQKYEQEVSAAKAQQERGTLPNLLQNAFRIRGVPESQVKDLAGFAQTGQMPGQYVQPPADLGGGPALPVPKFYEDDTVSQAMKILGLTNNAMAMGDKNSEKVTQSLGMMQDQDVLTQALEMQKRGDLMGMNALNAVRGKKEFTPFKAVGNTGTALNEVTGQQPVSNAALATLFGKEGESRIAENRAQAGASGALAGLRGVQTGNARIQGGIDALDYQAAKEGKPLPSHNRGANTSEGALSSTVIRTLQVPALDEKGRPVRNPMTGEIETTTDQDALKQFYSWADQNNRKPTAMAFSQWEAKGRPGSVATSPNLQTPAQKTAPTKPAKTSGGMPQVKTRAEAMALPKGTRFLDPDGIERVR